MAGVGSMMGTAALLHLLGCPRRVPIPANWGRGPCWAPLDPQGSTGAARSLVGLGQLAGEVLWTGDRARLELVGNMRLFPRVLVCVWFVVLTLVVQWSRNVASWAEGAGPRGSGEAGSEPWPGPVWVCWAGCRGCAVLCSMESLPCCCS